LVALPRAGPRDGASGPTLGWMIQALRAWGAGQEMGAAGGEEAMVKRIAKDC